VNCSDFFGCTESFSDALFDSSNYFNGKHGVEGCAFSYIFSVLFLFMWFSLGVIPGDCCASCMSEEGSEPFSSGQGKFSYVFVKSVSSYEVISSSVPAGY